MNTSFFHKISPEISKDIQNWSNNPELSKLLQQLCSATDAQRFLDYLAEAMVARHLLKKKCELEYEVPTINNRTADFRINIDDKPAYLHIKRLNVDANTTRDDKIMSRLQELRKIPKPVILITIFFRSISDKEMRDIYKITKNKICKDETGTFQISDSSGGLIAECEIIPSPKVKKVQLIFSLSLRVLEDNKRFCKKLSEAYRQFMRGETNIILVTSTWEDDIDFFKESLQDFWGNGKHLDSNITVWFYYSIKEDNITFKTYFRTDNEKAAYIKELFNA
jgi:hypothetical protein